MEPGGFQDELDPNVSEEELAVRRRLHYTANLIVLALVLGTLFALSLHSRVVQHAPPEMLSDPPTIAKQ